MIDRPVGLCKHFSPVIFALTVCVKASRRTLSAMASEQSILTSINDAVLTITLNRPDKLNAFNAAMSEAFLSAFQHAENNADIRAVLVTGAGSAFCAGQDLGDRDPRQRSEPPDLGHTLNTYYNPVVRQMRSLNKPIVCAVNGVAAGAGANIALACDLVIAARSARFIQSFAKVGLLPDSGGTWMLTHLLGEARAKALAMTATPIDAETALQWGLIWQVVKDDALHEQSVDTATRLAKGPTLGLGLIKQAIQTASTNDFETQLDLERDSQREAGLTNDYAEGVVAFLEKRSPNFRGN